MMRADEFSFILTWQPRVNGKQAPWPGFYARASFANEGEAQSVVKGTWACGVGGNGSLVSGGFIEGLVKLLDEHDLLESNINPLALAKRLSDGSAEAQNAAVRAKRARLESLRAELAQLEAEVG